MTDYRYWEDETPPNDGDGPCWHGDHCPGVNITCHPVTDPPRKKKDREDPT